jgi:hypothetical protein
MGESVEGELHPGDVCGQDGLYRVFHHLHRPPHDVIVSSGDLFPQCRHCGEAVRFQLITATSTIPARLQAKAARKRPG